MLQEEVFVGIRAILMTSRKKWWHLFQEYSICLIHTTLTKNVFQTDNLSQQSNYFIYNNPVKILLATVLVYTIEAG